MVTSIGYFGQLHPASVQSPFAARRDKYQYPHPTEIMVTSSISGLPIPSAFAPNIEGMASKDCQKRQERHPTQPFLFRCHCFATLSAVKVYPLAIFAKVPWTSTTPFALGATPVQRKGIFLVLLSVRHSVVQVAHSHKISNSGHPHEQAYHPLSLSPAPPASRSRCCG